MCIYLISRIAPKNDNKYQEIHTHTAKMSKSSTYYDRQALKIFLRKRVDEKMIQCLAYHTVQIIKIQPATPEEDGPSQVRPVPSLEDFIKGLVIGSNVQTPTLMTTVVFLQRLQKIIPQNVYGIETTRHRIFVGCLIIVAKMLNDSSPLNKHWCNYTSGLLSLQELNIIERELLEYFDWNLKFDESDLIRSLEPLLVPIKQNLQMNEMPAMSTMQNTSRAMHNSTAAMSSCSSASLVSAMTRDSVFSALSSNHSRSDSNISIPSIPFTVSIPALASNTYLGHNNKENNTTMHANIKTSIQMDRHIRHIGHTQNTQNTYNNNAFSQLQHYTKPKNFNVNTQKLKQQLQTQREHLGTSQQMNYI